MPDLGEEEHVREQVRGEGGVEGEVRRVGERELGRLEEVELDDWRAVAQRARHEGDAERERGHEAADDARVPVPTVALDEPGHQQPDRAHGEH